MNDINKCVWFADPYFFRRLLGESVKIGGLIIEQRKDLKPAIWPGLRSAGSRRHLGAEFGLGYRAVGYRHASRRGGPGTRLPMSGACCSRDRTLAPAIRLVPAVGLAPAITAVPVAALPRVTVVPALRPVRFRSAMIWLVPARCVLRLGMRVGGRLLLGIRIGRVLGLAVRVTGVLLLAVRVRRVLIPAVLALAVRVRVRHLLILAAVAELSAAVLILAVLVLPVWVLAVRALRVSLRFVVLLFVAALVWALPMAPVLHSIITLIPQAASIARIPYVSWILLIL